jgi:hypothetical protein
MPETCLFRCNLQQEVAPLTSQRRRLPFQHLTVDLEPGGSFLVASRFFPTVHAFLVCFQIFFPHSSCLSCLLPDFFPHSSCLSCLLPDFFSPQFMPFLFASRFSPARSLSPAWSSAMVPPTRTSSVLRGGGGAYSSVQATVTNMTITVSSRPSQIHDRSSSSRPP